MQPNLWINAVDKATYKIKTPLVPCDLICIAWSLLLLLCACCTWLIIRERERREKIRRADANSPAPQTSIARSSTPRHPTQNSSSSIVIDSIDLKRIPKAVHLPVIHYYFLYHWNNHHARYYTPTNCLSSCPTNQHKMLCIRSSRLWAFLQWMGKGFIGIWCWGKVSYWDF